MDEPTTRPRGWKPAALISRYSSTDRSEVKKSPCPRLRRSRASFGSCGGGLWVGGPGGCALLGGGDPLIKFGGGGAKPHPTLLSTALPPPAPFSPVPSPL